MDSHVHAGSIHREIVCREHGHGPPGVTHYFDAMRPLQLDEADAIALAAILNDVKA